MIKLIFLLILLFISTACVAEEYVITKADLIKLHVSNYVHGFKEFDTSVTTSNESLNIGIYYDYDTQEKERADSLANRFEDHVADILKLNGLGDDIEVLVNVYGEDRTGKGYY